MQFLVVHNQRIKEEMEMRRVERELRKLRTPLWPRLLALWKRLTGSGNVVYAQQEHPRHDTAVEACSTAQCQTPETSHAVQKFRLS
jgi:hypothetical protein